MSWRLSNTTLHSEKRMNISVSALSFLGLRFSQLENLPKEIGIEILCECGNDYYWDSQLAVCMKERTGLLSLHGPFLNMDLSSSLLSDSVIINNYIWTLQLAIRQGAKYVVVHPCANIPLGTDKKKAMQTSKTRLNMLASLSTKYNIPICVENMGHKDSQRTLYDTDDYLSIFNTFENFYALLDIGHAHIAGWDICDMISKLNSRILAVHFHDNDGLTDSHLPIYEGSVNWKPIVESIKTFSPNANVVLEYDNQPLSVVLDSIDTVKKWFE